MTDIFTKPSRLILEYKKNKLITGSQKQNKALNINVSVAYTKGTYDADDT